MSRLFLPSRQRLAPRAQDRHHGKIRRRKPTLPCNPMRTRHTVTSDLNLPYSRTGVVRALTSTPMPSAMLELELRRKRIATPRPPSVASHLRAAPGGIGQEYLLVGQEGRGSAIRSSLWYSHAAILSGHKCVESQRRSVQRREPARTHPTRWHNERHGRPMMVQAEPETSLQTPTLRQAPHRQRVSYCLHECNAPQTAPPAESQ